MYPSDINSYGHKFKLHDAASQRYRCAVCEAVSPQVDKGDQLTRVVEEFACKQDCRPVTFEMDVNEAEAWQLISWPSWGMDDWASYYFDPRTDDPTAASDFEKMQGQRIRFYHRGDLIVTATVIDIITPAEAAAAEGDEDDAPERRYRLDLDTNHAVWHQFSNAGLSSYRLIDPKLSVLERALIEKWQKENVREPGLNDTVGFLQALMLHHAPGGRGPKFDPPLPTLSPAWMNQRDRDIVATVVQWLGTNCGQSFLLEVNRRSGGMLKTLFR